MGNDHLHVGKLPKLNSKNSKEWAVAVSLYLRGAKYWTIIDGTRPEPAKEADDEDWDSHNALAAVLIFNQCDDTQKQHILNSKDAKKSWEILKAVHETPNKQRLGALLRQFYRFEQGSRSIDECVAYLNGLQADIRGISEKRAPDEYGKALFLLRGLSKDYELIETVLSNDLSDDETVDFNGLVNLVTYTFPE